MPAGRSWLTRIRSSRRWHTHRVRHIHWVGRSGRRRILVRLAERLAINAFGHASGKQINDPFAQVARVVNKPIAGIGWNHLGRLSGRWVHRRRGRITATLLLLELALAENARALGLLVR